MTRHTPNLPLVHFLGVEFVMAFISIVYPAREGARFDHDYYAHMHIRRVHEALAETGLLDARVYRGVSTLDGGPPPFVAMAHLTFRDEAAMQACLDSPAAPALHADVGNFTDIPPVIEIYAAG